MNLALAITITLALAGYLAAYLNNLAMARRKEQLELVSKQLNDFYGPLYLSSKASAIAYQAFRLKFGIVAKKAINADDSAVMREWRLWVAEVLMPMNQSQERIILSSAHLIREQEGQRVY